MATTTEIRDYTATMHIVEDVNALRRRREADNPLYCNAILCVWRVIYYAPPTLEMAVTISEIKCHLGPVPYIMSI